MRKYLLLLAMTMVLSGCGADPLTRGVTGGLIGAGGGAAVAGATGHKPATGAVLGGVGGAGIGALTAH